MNIINAIFQHQITLIIKHIKARSSNDELSLQTAGHIVGDMTSYASSNVGAQVPPVNPGMATAPS